MAYKPTSLFYLPPDKEQAIWRYMDFTKFVNLISTRFLYFTRSDNFDDVLEGSNSRANKRFQPIIHNGIPTEVMRYIAEKNKLLCKFIYISCWCINNNESDAMWQIYLKSQPGIAIKSTINRLIKSMEKEKEDISIGAVKYIDYEHDFIPENTPIQRFVFKEKAYEHEKELRALIYKNPEAGGNMKYTESPLGVTASVDLDCLIEKVVVAPSTPAWVYKTIQDTMKAFNINKTLYYSKLDQTPVY